MANNKWAGYKPKKEESPTRLDRVNPYEFRKGMDYELTEMGISRLQESTPEEREKATESVLKNLESHGGYYTALLTYETTYKNLDKKPTFKTWLSEQDEFRMKEVDQKFKNDKMTEPKEKTKEENIKANLKKSSLEESIKEKIKRKILEAKKDKKDEDEEDALDKKARKGAKGAKSKLNKFDQERESLEELIEYLKEKKDKELEKYKSSKKDKKAIEAYKKAIELSEKDKKKLEKTAEKFDVASKDYIEKDIPSTIKSLEKRLKAVDKDETEAISKLREEKKEIAATDMTREELLRLLNIIKENGISLREGKDSIKTYYEIAKASFLEGLTKGAKL